MRISGNFCPSDVVLVLFFFTSEIVCLNKNESSNVVLSFSSHILSDVQWEPNPAITETTTSTLPIIVDTNQIVKEIKSPVNITKTRKFKRKRRLRKLKQIITSTTTLPSIDENANGIQTQTKDPGRKLRRNKFKRRQKNKKRIELATINAVNSLESTNNLNRNKVGKKKKQLEQEKGNIILEVTTAKSFNLTLQKNFTEGSTKNNILKGNHISFPRKMRRKKRNRCKKNRGGCEHICLPRGKTKCSCFEGFHLGKDQERCFDIDECKVNNGGCQMECVNTVGSRECKCSSGLRLTEDSRTCQDINECLLRNGHGPCQDTCENTRGGYKCSCGRLNGTRLGEDGHKCLDVDECAEGTAGCSHQCVNTFGQYFCFCPTGMELSSDLKTCEDINECEDESIQKSCENGCVNTPGSYRCVNVSELQNEQSSNDVACQQLLLPFKGYFNCSRNLVPDPKTGRKRVVNSPGTVCRLECPVGYRLTGEYSVTCGLNGEWEGEKKEKCKPALSPKIECPPSQTQSLNKANKKILVKFTQPKTNINWKYVKSFPDWAKNLTGFLEKGRHTIGFVAKDPSTKLVASCSFKIIIVN